MFSHTPDVQKQNQCSGNLSPFPKPCRCGSYFGQHAVSVIVCWRSADPRDRRHGAHQGFPVSTRNNPLHTDTPKAFKSLYFPHLETSIRTSFAQLFPVSVASPPSWDALSSCRVLSSAKLQTHSGPPIHPIHKFKRKTEGLMKCSMSYSEWVDVLFLCL